MGNLLQLSFIKKFHKKVARIIEHIFFVGSLENL